MAVSTRHGLAALLVGFLLLAGSLVGGGPRTDLVPAAGPVRASTGPAVLNVTPWDGQLLGQKSPTILVVYASFGVPVAGVDFHLDGMNLTSAGSFNDTVFVLPLALELRDGPHVANFTVMDVLGMAAFANWTFFVDTIPPILFVTSPAYPIVTVSAVLVEGTARVVFPLAAPVTVTVMVLPSYLVLTTTAAANGSFALLAPLSEGLNALFINATDRAGNLAVDVMTIVVDTTPPTVRVSLPLDGLETNQSTVAVEGTVDDRNATVLVNGQEIRPNADGSWRTTVALVAGENRIAVIAVDAAGNRGPTVVKTVTYTPPWPGLDDRISENDRTFSVWGSTLSLALGAVFLLLLTLLFAIYVRLNGRIVRLRGLPPGTLPAVPPGTEANAAPTPDASEPKPPA